MGQGINKGFGDIFITLDVEVQAWLVSELELPGAQGPSDIHNLCLLDRSHAIAEHKSNAHQLLEEAWFQLYAVYTDWDSRATLIQRGLVVGIMWMIERKLGYTPEYRYTDRADYTNHLRCRHDPFMGVDAFSNAVIQAHKNELGQASWLPAKIQPPPLSMNE